MRHPLHGSSAFVRTARRHLRHAAAVVLVAFFGAGALLVGAGAAAADQVWTVQSVPNAPMPVASVLSAVACPSSNECIAVGHNSNQYSQTDSLAEKWNGSSWSVSASAAWDPTDEPSAQSELSAVACPSSSDCVAVGEAGGTTLAAIWNGSSWSFPAMPSTFGDSNALLTGVSCLSATSCFAVGYGVTQSQAISDAIVESWNGSTWSKVTTPAASVSNLQLSLISCAASSCLVYGQPVAGGLFAETRKGSSWSTASTASLASGLSGLSCTSATMCVGVGSTLGEDRLFASVWNGSTWQTTAAPPVPTAGQYTNEALNSVACEASNCTAVGYYQDNTDNQDVAIAEQWNGSSWTMAATPPSPGGANLYGVAYASSSSTMSVGTYLSTALGITALLALQSSGTSWADSPVRTPTSGAGETDLIGIACPGSSSCIAVGYWAQNAGSSFGFPVAERWNGKAWSLMTVRDPAGGHDAALNSIFCTSTTSCVAVGYYDDSSNKNDPLVEQWNGTSWSIVTTPAFPAGVGAEFLNGVTCTSAQSCIAVGYTDPSASGSQQPFAVSWNGTSWSVMQVPAVTDLSSPYLQGVACAAGTCVAAGAGLNNASQVTEFADSWTLSSGWSACASTQACLGEVPGEMWDGSDWISDGAGFPPQPPSNGVFNDVACTAPRTCIAVGLTESGFQWTPLAELGTGLPQGQTMKFTSTPPSPAIVGGKYVVTATATSGLPVSFVISGLSTSVCSISGSTVTFTAAGTCTIVAEQFGSANYNPAPTVVQSIQVGLAQTVTFTSTPAPFAPVGGTYVVSASSSSALPVQISIDPTSGSICSLSGSTVTYNAIGTCTIDANQAGNTVYLPAAEVQQVVTVGAPQTVEFTSAPPSPALVGGIYEVTATATSGLPVGLSIDSSSTSICTLGGSATTGYIIAFDAAGTCVVDANQPGSATSFYLPAAQVQQTVTVAGVAGDPTSTKLAQSPGSAVTGSPVTYTATVTPTPNGGTVTVTDLGTVVPSCQGLALVSGKATCKVTYTEPGTQLMVASYSGNSTYAPSASAPLAETVKWSTTTTLASSANPAGAGKVVTFTATVAPNPGGGSISFSDNGTAITGCKALAASSGKATCKFTFAKIGTYDVVAAYSGDTTYAASRSAKLVEYVKKATATTLASSANPARTGEAVTFTATLTPNPAGGKISFSDNGKAIAGCEGLAAASGKATCKLSFTTAATYGIVAAYSGDTTYAPSRSAKLAEKVT